MLPLFILSIHSSPLSTVSVVKPYSDSIFSATLRFSFESSTIREVTPLYLVILSVSVFSKTTFDISSGIVTENTLPTPYVLSTFIVPPSISTKLLVIARPSPVPSIDVFLSASSLSNFVNKWESCSSFIPRPVSFTIISKLHILSVFSTTTFKSTRPLSVYLIAFDSKFDIICFTLFRSPYKTLGKLLSISTYNFKSFEPILVSSSFASFCISSLGL